ncbi:unnamed protein product [Clonostachys byssicola]|uniref:Calpain catalytic domain-containing protein n=1 Tax=Clonostachys byssicola TaxID=160290 RepID=A0A9N9UXY6_9HYPO|nr:unnamed protein product [Clonostachys byssicola]
MYVSQGDQQPSRKASKIHPQTVVSRFWSRYHSKAPGKVTSIFPQKLYRDLAVGADSPREQGRNAAQSYEEARSRCLDMVRVAVAQCESTNTKFCDSEFDIDTDLFCRKFDCLLGLETTCHHQHDSDDSSDDSSSDDDRRPRRSRSVRRSLKTILSSGILADAVAPVNLKHLETYMKADNSPPAPTTYRPRAVHRVDWIFENPQFTVDGFSSSDIKQGAVGDCWWLAGVANIAHRRDLMDKICVARDEECGVYGFVFYRDGEWISTVIDDNLYLIHEDFGHSFNVHDPSGKRSRTHKKERQTGSESLFFSKCNNENETWLPLLEKAYAKVHGDYESLNGGWPGYAVEDLTGGVMTVIPGNRVLRKEKLWREMTGVDRSDSEFVFGLTANSESYTTTNRNGLVLGHAYSIHKAVEIEDENGKKVRLIKVRNPWGERSNNGLGEWHGPWSDGSKEWTPEMIRKLNYSFADNGNFWMTFEDVLSNFRWIFRTRLFDERWTVAQQWMSSPVSWVAGFLRKKFIVEIKREGLVVIVLSTLDDRYFRGLAGPYAYFLEFVVRQLGSPLVLAEAKCHRGISERRSVNCEVHLKPGVYEILPRVTAERHPYKRTVEEVVKDFADVNPHKLRQVGMQYDLAHSKTGVLDEDEAQERKKSQRRRKKKEQKAKQEKLKDMKEAMEKMQQAMAGMQDELSKKKGEWERGAEKEKNDSPHEEAQGQNTKNDDYVSSRPPPGCWPGDMSSSESGYSKPSTDTSVTTVQRSGDERRDDTGTRRAPSSARQALKPDNLATEQAKDTPLPPQPQPDTLIAEGEETPAESDSDSESSESESDSDTEQERGRKQPWNPVCVMGLRVYAQDTEVSVRLTQGDQDP